MPETPYIVAVLATVFIITLGLRALPFAVLSRLQESVLVKNLSVWMPVGILGILAVSTLRTTVTADAGAAVPALAAVAITIGTHLVGGRRTLLSVGLGTVNYVALVNLL